MSIPPHDTRLIEKGPPALGRVLVDGFARTPRLKGVQFHRFLETFHRERAVKRYLEIGAHAGDSLRRVTGRAVAIDPSFQLDRNVWAAKPEVALFEMTSDEFFAGHDPREHLEGTIELAFIDGMHLSEFALRDFDNVERYCDRGSMIVLHDALPMNFEMTERNWRPDLRRDKELAGFWTGDVWRLVPLLARERPALHIEVLDCPPTGLVLVSDLDPQSSILSGRLGELTRWLTEREPSEAEFWSFMETVDITDSRTFFPT